MTRRRLLALLALLGFEPFSPAFGERVGPQRVARVNGGWPIDDFTLTDQHGKAFTLEHLRGRWTLVLFGDTRCGEHCTAALSALRGMCQRIAPTQKLKTTQVLFVSLGADTPERLRQYLAPFDERFIGASGPPAAVAQLADDLGVAETLPEPSGASDTVSGDYPGVLSLVDPDAVVWGQFLPPFDVMLLTARYLKTRVGR